MIRSIEHMDELVFTPSAVLHLLTEIDELKDKNISLSELSDGNLQISIGDSTYNIVTGDSVEVEVDDSVIETVVEENIQTYEELTDNANIEISEPVESGVLSGIVKSLLLGGMIRLAPKLLK